MVTPDGIRTARLRLRRWHGDDAERFAQLNADPKVTRYLPGPLEREESDELLARIEAEWTESGFGLWAVEEAGSHSFVGFAGLHQVPDAMPFAPAVEVGWRLLPEYWDNGYATEAAAAAMADGFDRTGLEEIVSFTTQANIRSQRVMQRLGMRHVGEFEHPVLPTGHPLRPHVLYRLHGKEWIAGR